MPIVVAERTPTISCIEARVTDNQAEHRYEIHADGRLAGFVTYQEDPGRISFVHTEIYGEFEGQGLGSTLAAGALDDARRRGLSVQPFCPFVNAYIKRHPEYVDLVPKSDRGRFGLLTS
jgi:predicted GNAT family acetyltransferase